MYTSKFKKLNDVQRSAIMKPEAELEERKGFIRIIVTKTNYIYKVKTIFYVYIISLNTFPLSENPAAR